ncbi:MAG TPA: elongation factor P, partial [Candidatus Binatia bacterium]|nr:elongation factor P [Candidatus Binatia bacterium]
MVIATDLKPGSAVRIEGQVYKVLEIESKAGTAKLGGVVKAKLSNVASGRLWEPHFRPQERLEDLELERRNMEFLYGDEDGCTFMDPVSFEQVQVPLAIVGPAEKFLQPGMQIPVEFFETQPISIVFPDVVEVRVADTAPVAHSQQDSTFKEATLENDLVVRVPLFIASGELIRVDVRSLRYVERARASRKS